MARQIGNARRGIGARWRSAALIVGALLAFVVAGVALAGSSAFTLGASLPTIMSDKVDYSPGATVTLTGVGWVGATDSAPAESVHIVVNDTVGQTWSHAATVTPDANGNITDVFQLPNYFVSDYDVTATGTLSGTATTTFTDRVGLNLDQCQNGTLANLGVPCGDSPLTGGSGWQNGDVNGSNSQYREGDGLPYRNAITGLANGIWTITVDYDFSKGGVPAIDRLTRYNLTQQSNPCHDTNLVNCTVGSPAFSFTAPGEVLSPSATKPALPNSGDLHTWGGSNGLASVLLGSKGADAGNMYVWADNCNATFINAGQNWTGAQATSFNDGKVQQNGSAAGDSDRQFSFKVNLTNCAGGNLMMGWSGHIASHLDWGTPPGGAGSISGAPFHMRILGVDNTDGTSGGNQDRSVQLSAIVQTLEVRKVLSPVGSGTFDLQEDGATKAAAVGNGGTTGPVAVSAGNHSVGELGAGGTSLSNFSSSISCVNSAGIVVASGSGTSLSNVNVPIGDSIVCTITNTLLETHLTLVKHVTNDNGGTAQQTDWTLSASGPTPISGATGSAAVTNATVTSGSYALSESGPSGYSSGTGYSCVGGTQNGQSVALAPGQSATCTITNNDIAPQLKLIKTVINNDGGTKVANDWDLTATGSGGFTELTPAAADATSRNVTAGVAYALSETGPAGYTPTSYSCVTNGGAPVVGNSITLGLSDSAVCTITNNDIAPQLKLIKTVINNDGGTKVANDWDLTATGSGGFTELTPAAADATSRNVTAGVAYALSETGPAGYTPTSYSCVTNGGAPVVGNSITLGLSDSAVCTITNNDIAPQLKLIKTVINNDGGTKVANDWDLTATGSGGFTELTPAAADATSRNVTAGVAYALSETGPAGYTPTSYSCVTNGGAPVVGNSITLGLSDSAVCTITNDDIAPQLKLIKTVINNDGGTKVANDWDLTATGSGGFTELTPAAADATSRNVTAGVAYALSETGPAGYTPTSYSCVTNGGAPVVGNSITLAPGDSAVCTITNNDIAPQLKLIKTVINNDGGTKVANDWDLTATGSGGFTELTPAAADATSRNVTAGVAYALSETGPAGYTPTSYSCVTNGGAPVVGNSITLGLSDSAVCTITNNDIAPQLKLIKTVINNDGGTKVANDWDLTATGSGGFTELTPAAADATSRNVTAGVAYALSETGPAGYTPTSYSCVTNGGAPVVGNSITLGLSDSAVCTITNNDIAPQLKLIKTVINNDGGTKVANDWDLTATGSGGFTELTPAAADATSRNVTAGVAYALSETGPAGYTPTSYSCVTNGGAPVVGNSITLGLSDSAVCTITNNDIPGHARVIKTVSGQPIPVGPDCTAFSPTCFQFQLRDGASTTQAGNTLASLYAGGANGGTINFTTNLSANHTYQLCEVVMPGWSTTLGSFVPNSFMPPDGVAPNPGVDNSILCIDFTVSLDQTKEFAVDNTPPPGGRALTIGFWKNWASCASSSGKGQKPVLDQTLAAAAIIPDGLNKPGIVVSATSGFFALFGPQYYLVLHGSAATPPGAAPDCAKAVNLLNKTTTDGKTKKASDAAFNMAAQLVAAELNYTAGSGKFPDVTTDINRGVLLLGKYTFNGLTHGTINGADTTTMNCLATALDDYNNDRTPRKQCP